MQLFQSAKTGLPTASTAMPLRRVLKVAFSAGLWLPGKTQIVARIVVMIPCAVPTQSK